MSTHGGVGGRDNRHQPAALSLVDKVACSQRVSCIFTRVMLLERWRGSRDVFPKTDAPSQALQVFD